MTRKKTAATKSAGKKKVKDLKLNKETVENLSDKSGQIKGGLAARSKIRCLNTDVCPTALNTCVC